MLLARPLAVAPPLGWRSGGRPGPPSPRAPFPPPVGWAGRGALSGIAAGSGVGRALGPAVFFPALLTAAQPACASRPAHPPANLRLYRNVNKKDFSVFILRFALLSRCCNTASYFVSPLAFYVVQHIFAGLRKSRCHDFSAYPCESRALITSPPLI